MRTIKLTLLFTGLLFIYTATSAQSSLNYLVGSSASGTLATDNYGNAVNTAGATNLIGNQLANAVSSLQPIGFDFIFMGKYYSHFLVGTNGQVGLGIYNSPAWMLSNVAPNDLTRTVVYPPTAADNAPVLAAFWDKMNTPSTGATIRSVVTGTAPNRCRVIAWNSVINNSGAFPSPSGVFQMRLYEGSGIIEYVYGNMSVVSSSTTVTASIGFTAGSADNQFLALQNLTSFTFTALAASEPATQSLVNSATAGTITDLNSTADGNRRVLKFSPTALTGSSLTGFQVTQTGATNVSLKWDDTYTNESAYTVLVSSDNVNFTTAVTTAANINSVNVGGLTLGNTYYFKVIANTAGASFTSNVLSATTGCYFNGTYTIGTGGDYATLSKAADSLKVKGIAGNVVFELLNTYNPAAETFPVTFPKTAQLPCLGNYKVTVRPQASATNISISGTSNNPLVLLDSVHYVVFDGRPGGTGNSKELSIINSGAAPSIRLLNSSNIKCSYLKLGGGFTGTSTYEGVVNVEGSKAAGSDNNLFTDCDIFSTATAPAGKAFLFYSTATNSSDNFNDSIVHCNFYNYSKSAISLTTYSAGWKIISNSFYNTGNITYDASAQAIDITTPYPINTHFVLQNHFGGMAPGAQGGVMNIGYGQGYSCVNIYGMAVVSNNYFARMRLFSTVGTYQGNVKMISLSNPTNVSSYIIDNNKIGSADPADSISVLQSNGDNNMQVWLVGTNAPGNTTITNNEISNIKCYSPSGSIEFCAVRAAQGAKNIQYNRIGNPAVLNSIANYSGGSTYGIVDYSGTAVINNNTVSRLTSLADYNSKILAGIYHSSGTVDSIYNNTVYHCTIGDGGTGGNAALIGIGAYPTTAGGLHNLVGRNNIYSLTDNWNTGGGEVSGIKIGYNMNVRNNLIRNLSSNNVTTNSSIYGILIPDKESFVENNMVSLGLDSTGNSITAGNIFFGGISGGTLIRHNSVYIGGSNVTDGLNGSACFLFLGNALATANVNNVFFNARSNEIAGGNARHQCVNIQTSNTSDYNLYYFTGNNGITGSYANNRYNDLAAWRTATGLDLHTISANPLFILPAANSLSVNLHAAYGSPVESAGWSAYTLQTDFDNESRGLLTPVDIGADANNFGVCPIADAGADRAIVPGDSTTLGGPLNPNVQYSWVAPGFSSTEANPRVSPAVNTIYVLTITSGACTSVDSVLVTVLSAPPATTICPGGSGVLTEPSAGTVYRWQVDTGAGFTDISNGTNYAGANTNTLQLVNLPSSFYGYEYRCLVNGLPGIRTVLKFGNAWTGAINNLWSVPGNWSCGSVPDGNTDVIIGSGPVVLDVNGICRSFNLSPGVVFTVNAGSVLTVTH